MRTWIAAAFAMALGAAGCSSSQTAQDSPGIPPASEPGSAAAPRPQAPPAASAPQSGAEWEELLRQLKKGYEISAQQKESQADEHYRLVGLRFLLLCGDPPDFSDI